MQTTTFQLQRLPIKKKSLRDVEGETANAEFCLDAITELAVAIDF
jgi:hypothetical protein